jgi:hypothetical protein
VSLKIIGAYKFNGKKNFYFIDVGLVKINRFLQDRILYAL